MTSNLDFRQRKLANCISEIDRSTQTSGNHLKMNNWNQRTGFENETKKYT